MPTYPSFSIQSQPTDSTCGPTCLHAVYQYWNDTISLEQVIGEVGADLASSDSNDLAGDPAGHFVVLYGIERTGNKIWIADPLTTNPLGDEHLYYASFEKVLAALFLGIVTYDANLLTVRPRRSETTPPLDRT